MLSSGSSLHPSNTAACSPTLPQLTRREESLGFTHGMRALGAVFSLPSKLADVKRQRENLIELTIEKELK